MSFDKFWSDKLDEEEAGEYDEVKSVCRTETSCFPTHNTQILIDGDILAYKAASTTDGRHYVHPEVEGIEFKYKADADKYCSGNDLDLSDITIHYRPEPVSHALHNIDMSMRAIYDRFIGEGPVSILVFLTGSLNFRSEVAPHYKSHRKGDHRPEHLDACKEYLQKAYKAEIKEGLEADDLIGCEAMSCRKAEIPYVIVTTDKDLFCIPGDHYNPSTGVMRLTSEYESMLFFYRQLLVGDSTDNIKGVPGCGPKGADKVLEKFSSGSESLEKAEWDVYISVLCVYFDYHKSRLKKEYSYKPPEELIYHTAKMDLETNARMLWILREPYVMWNAPRKPDESMESKEAKGKSEEETESS